MYLGLLGIKAIGKAAFILIIMAMYYNYAGSCRVNPKTHPVKNKVALFTATQNIGDWEGLCTYLRASETIMTRLKFSKDQDITKKWECLTGVFNNFRLDWETVVGVVGNFPISNPREACKIAKEYIGIEGTECQCIISAHGNSKKIYETGMKV